MCVLVSSCTGVMQVFEPEYFPVIPDERVTFGDDISLKSNIQPLEMTKDKVSWWWCRI